VYSPVFPEETDEGEDDEEEEVEEGYAELVDTSKCLEGWGVNLGSPHSWNQLHTFRKKSY